MQEQPRHMAEKVKLNTPVGIAKYPKVSEPDKPAYGGDYKCPIILDPGAKGVKELRAEVNRVLREAYAPGKLIDPKTKKMRDNVRTPFKEVKQDDGSVVLEFMTRSKYQPAVFDSKGKPVNAVDVKIGGGSKVRLGVTLQAFGADAPNPGVRAYLDSVTIATLKVYEGRAASAPPIDPEDLDGDSGFVAGDEQNDGDFEQSDDPGPVDEDAYGDTDPLDF